MSEIITIVPTTTAVHIVSHGRVTTLFDVDPTMAAPAIAAEFQLSGQTVVERRPGSVPVLVQDGFVRLLDLDESVAADLVDALALAGAVSHVADGVLALGSERPSLPYVTYDTTTTKEH